MLRVSNTTALNKLSADNSGVLFFTFLHFDNMEFRFSKLSL